MAIENNIAKVAGGSVLISTDGGTTFELENAKFITAVGVSVTNPYGVIFRFERGQTIRQSRSGEIHFLYGNVLDEDGNKIGGSPQAVVNALQALFFLASGGGSSTETVTALTISGGVVDWDVSLGRLATLLLNDNITFNKPTNLTPGTLLLRVTVGPIPPYTINWDSNFKFSLGGTNYVATPVAGAVGQVAFVYYGDTPFLYGDFSNDYQ